MQDVLFLTRLEQLKALSDPLRMAILARLMEQPYTGQQLARILEVPRSKVHYHLGEMEKNGIVEVVRREEKQGIMQKFYRAVARSIVPSSELLGFVDAHSVRSVGLEVVEKTREEILRAPPEALEFKEGSIQEQTSLFYNFQVQMKPREFAVLLGEIEKILGKIESRDGSGEESFFVSFTGFSRSPQSPPAP